jgi:hypothetical protein
MGAFGPNVTKSGAVREEEFAEPRKTSPGATEDFSDSQQDSWPILGHRAAAVHFFEKFIRPQGTYLTSLSTQPAEHRLNSLPAGFVDG